MKLISTIAAACAVTAISGCDDLSMGKQPATATNPAATFCVNKGHNYEIRKGAEGNEYGVCQFKGGGEMDAWEYFRSNATGANPDLSQISSES